MGAKVIFFLEVSKKILTFVAVLLIYVLMKKIFVALVALVALGACSSEPKKFTYRGIPTDVPFQAFIDSLSARGFAIDSAKSDSAMTRVVMAKAGELYRLMLAQKNYKVSTNDSTRQLWQQMRDQFEKELGAWPNMPKHGDDHKIAKFEAEGGFITLTLENTYTPTLQVLYEIK